MLFRLTDPVAQLGELAIYASGTAIGVLFKAAVALKIDYYSGVFILHRRATLTLQRTLIQ